MSSVVDPDSEHEPEAQPPDSARPSVPGEFPPPPLDLVAEPRESQTEFALRGGSALRVEPLAIDLGVLLRWAGYAALLILVAGVAGFVLSGLRTDIYAARTEIFFPLDADRGTGFLREDRRISTQLESIRSRAVLTPVAATHGLSISAVSDQVSAAIVGDSEIIRIEARDEDPDRALSLVASVSETYLGQLSDPGVEAARALLDEEAADLAARARSIDERLTEIDLVSRSLAADESLPAVLEQELTLLLAEQVNISALQAGLDQRVTDFEVAQALLPRPTVLAAPYALVNPVSPNQIFDTAVAMAVGATLAALLIAVLLIRGSVQPRTR